MSWQEEVAAAAPACCYRALMDKDVKGGYIILFLPNGNLFIMALEYFDRILEIRFFLKVS